MRRFNKVSLFAAGALALASVACGDDDGGGGGTPDANTGGNPDAMPDPEQVRAGTIAIAQSKLTNIAGIEGGTISVSWSDLTTATVAPVEGFDNPVGSCLITVFDVADNKVPPTATNEGDVSVTGHSLGDATCKFSDAAKRYLCQSDNATIAGPASADGVGATGAFDAGTGQGTITFTFGANKFPADAMKGQFLFVTGFEDGADGGGAASSFNGKFLPIVGENAAAGVVVVANTVGFTGPAKGAAAATYSNYIGLGPVPGGGITFLTKESAIGISKPASDHIGAIDLTGGSAMTPNGEGLKLDDASAQPHQFPATAAEALTFTCAGTGGTCGNDDGGGLKVLSISGETTDAPLAGLGPFDMPEPVGKFATFQCSAISDQIATGVSIPTAGLTAILGTTPTRVRTTVGMFNGSILPGATGTTNVVVGHLLIGVTTMPAE
jgi:hypothetical protein